MYLNKIEDFKRPVVGQLRISNNVVKDHTGMDGQQIDRIMRVHEESKAKIMRGEGTEVDLVNMGYICDVVKALCDDHGYYHDKEICEALEHLNAADERRKKSGRIGLTGDGYKTFDELATIYEALLSSIGAGRIQTTLDRLMRECGAQRPEPVLSYALAVIEQYTLQGGMVKSAKFENELERVLRGVGIRLNRRETAQKVQALIDAGLVQVVKQVPPGVNKEPRSYFKYIGPDREVGEK
jgi:hypothetical protein